MADLNQRPRRTLASRLRRAALGVALTLGAIFIALPIFLAAFGITCAIGAWRSIWSDER